MLNEISLVRIKLSGDCVGNPRIAYVFRVLLNIVGVRFLFTDELEKADIYYGDRAPDGFRGLYIPAKVSREVLHPKDLETLKLDEYLYVFQHDVLIYCFKCLSGELEPKKDDCGVPICAAATPTEAFAYSNPIIHMVAAQINECLCNLKSSLNVVPLWPQSKRMALIFTHDVDAPFSCIKLGFRKTLLFRRIKDRDLVGSVRVVMGILKRLGEKIWVDKYGTSNDPQLGFKYWIGLQKLVGARPTFFLATRTAAELGADHRDVTYELNDEVLVRELLDALGEGAEVGLHGSINSKSSVGVLKEELDRLQVKLTDAPITSIRNHFWSVDNSAELTLLNHQSVGLKVDSSLGLNDSPGFRRGICVPFFPWNRFDQSTLDILSIPNTCMDGGIFYSETCVESGVEKLKSHISLVRRYSGAAVLNWHLEQSSRTRLNGAGEALGRFIASMPQGQQDEIYFCTITELADWWLKRTKMLEVPNEESF